MMIGCSLCCSVDGHVQQNSLSSCCVLYTVHDPNISVELLLQGRTS